MIVNNIRTIFFHNLRFGALIPSKIDSRINLVTDDCFSVDESLKNVVEDAGSSFTIIIQRSIPDERDRHTYINIYSNTINYSCARCMCNLYVLWCKCVAVCVCV